jgi:hypothetical protein
MRLFGRNLRHKRHNLSPNLRQYAYCGIYYAEKSFMKLSTDASGTGPGQSTRLTTLARVSLNPAPFASVLARSKLVRWTLKNAHSI